MVVMAGGNTIAACTALLRPEEVNNEKRGLFPMKDVNVYPGQSGGWIYEVWIAARLVVVGWCRTREAAESEAALA